MEPFIRYILMAIGLLILVFIFLNSLRHRKQQNKFSHHQSIPKFNQVFFGDEEPEDDFIEETEEENALVEEELEKDFAEEGYPETFQKNDIKLEERGRGEKLPDDFVQIAVIAENGKTFGGYDLLQTLTANHFYFGDMNIFHFHQDMNPSSKKLFSLASLQKPGDFDLDRIGLFKTKGLVLFMNRADHPEHADHVYELMEEIAYQLSEELGGIIKR